MSRLRAFIAVSVTIPTLSCADRFTDPGPTPVDFAHHYAHYIRPNPDTTPVGGGGVDWPPFGVQGDRIYEAPGDPHPDAPGIWLGANVTPATCFADRNPGIADADKDWLADHCELELARGFAPSWGMSADDGCPGAEPLWAAKYHNNQQVVRLAYLPAYYDDCGGSSAFDHRGDSEFVMVQVVFNAGTQHWEYQTMWLSCHWHGGINSCSQWVSASETQFRVWPLAHPYVIVAERKHSNYRAADVCGEDMFNYDECQPFFPFRFPVDPARNVGSRHVALVPCIGSYGAMAGSGRTECFYTEDRSFCGWHPTNTECPPSYYDYLTSQYFERFDTDWGPGPVPPGGGAGPTGPTISGSTQLNGDQPGSWSIVWSGKTPSSCAWYVDEQLAQNGSCSYSRSFYDWPNTHYLWAEVVASDGSSAATPSHPVYVGMPDGEPAYLKQGLPGRTLEPRRPPSARRPSLR